MDVLKKIKLSFTLSLIVVLVFYIFGQIILPSERDVLVLESNKFNADWEQISDNGDRIPVEVPGKVKAEPGEEVRVVTTLPADMDTEQVMAFSTIWQDAKIYIDGELRAEYSTKDTRPFGKNSTFRYVFVELRKGDSGKELMYCLTTGTKYSGTIRNIYIGDKVDIILDLFVSKSAVTIPAALLFILSLFGIAVCVFLRVIYKKHLTVSYLIIAMMLCSIWMISELEFRQILFSNISVLACLTYVSVMLISVPFVLFINEVQNERYSKIFSVPLTYNMIVFVGATMLQVMNIVDFVDVLPFAHVGIIIASVCIIVTMINEIRNKKIKEYKYVSIGILGLVVSTFFEIILYYLNFTNTIGTALVAGLLFLLLMAVVKTGQDLMETEKKKHEAILAREAQSNFLANMSHEIRTPINAIIGMNEMVLREASDENVIEYSNAIRSSSQSLLSIINDVLDISKIESGKMEIVESNYELSSLITDCHNVVIERVRAKGLNLHIECDENCPVVLCGDVAHIRQVIINLLTNAVKYTENGDVYFRIKGEKYDDQWYLMVEVEDTGIGIAKENIDKLFVKFERFDLQKNRSVEGTGLGLNIVKSFVELMGGTIKVESEYGKGSLFTIRIPQKIMNPAPIGKINTASVVRGKQPAKRVSDFIAPQAKILIVDDVPANLHVFINLVKHYKMQVDTATCGQQCLSLAAQTKYDMIFMDHMMPEMDGIETLGNLKKDPDNLNSDTVVIMLTANALIGMKEMYLEKGFTDYLSKPVIPEKLENMIDRYLSDDKKISPDSASSAGKGDGVSTHANDAKTVDNSTPLQRLKRLMPDVNTQSAIRYCGGEEDMYIELLRDYTAEGIYNRLSEAYDKMDFKAYELEVHTLKSTSRTLGFDKLGNIAERMQLAAAQNDADTINTVHDDMMSLYKKILDTLAEVLQ